MSAYLYDKAIVSKLQEITGDNRVRIINTQNVFNVIPKEANDKFTLPLVTLYRTSWSINSDKFNHSAKFEGGVSKIDATQESIKIQRLQFVPMEITWSLDVWTRTREENDEYIRELIWFFLVSPTFTINIPYGVKQDHIFNVYADDNIEDNSDVAQHLNTGEYFRQTITLYTDDAKLWKSSSRGPTTIDIFADISESVDSRKE